jgi:hypothetical protein
LNEGQWAKSIAESIHAVESVARKIEPSANTLYPAFKKLAPKIRMHPAMQKSFSTLYGFTSDEHGLRHALIDQSAAAVDRDMRCSCERRALPFRRTCEQSGQRQTHLAEK